MALRQRTNAYWAKRANERLVASEKTSDKYRREIRKVYTQAQRDTLEQLKKIYADYWTKDGGFDKQKLRLMTSSKDMNAFVTKLKKAGLYDKIPENYLGRINRLEFLNAQMWYESHLAGMKQDGILTSANRQVYEDSYYRSIYDVSKGIGSTPSFTMLDKQTVNQILDTEFDGKNYSERIWGNSDILANQLKDKLAVAIATGQSIQKTARDFRERFNVQNYYAERLVRTETNYFHNSAELESYSSMGFEYYEFVATLDSRTSEICAEMDGKRFKVSEARQGDNAPPLHPNCRSTIVPYFKDFEPDGTRMYRNPRTGQNEYTYDVTYADWKEQFVEELSTTGRRTDYTLIDKPRKRAEETIRPKKFETLLIMDEKNRVVHAEKGGAHSVMPSKKSFNLMSKKGYSVSHNHPSGSSFSSADLKLASEYNLRSIRAVSKHFTFEASPKGEWANPADISRVHAKYIRAAHKAAREWYERTGKDISNYMWGVVTDKAMKKIAKELNMNYKSVKIDIRKKK